MSTISKSSSKIDIIIVNWNSGYHLNNCITSLYKHNALSVCNIFVNDNNSSDGSIENIERTFKEVKIIKQKINIGFAAGCNRGASEGKAEYLLFLNPDILITENSILGVLNFYESRKQSEKIGVVGIRLYNTDGSIGISFSIFPRIYHFIFQILGLHKLFTLLSPLRKGELLIQPTIVDQITGAFYFISRKTFENFSGFDEQFFVYYEELDLNLRLNRNGYTSYTLPSVTAFHYGGGCSEYNSSKSLAYNMASRIKFYRKNYSLFEYYAIYFITVYIELPLRFIKSYFLRKRLVGFKEIFNFINNGEKNDTNNSNEN